MPTAAALPNTAQYQHSGNRANLGIGTALGDSADAEKARYHEGDAELLASAHAVQAKYQRGKVVEGTIASANFWNSEVDRINWLHSTFGAHSCLRSDSGSELRIQTFCYAILH